MAFNPNEPRGKRGRWAKSMEHGAKPGRKHERLAANLKRAAVIAGLTTAGVVVGAVVAGGAGEALLPRGRLLREGESTVGKVVFTHQDAVTPLGLFGADRALNKAARNSPGAALAARINQKLGLPRRHYGVGVGGDRIVERMNRRGVRAISTRDFSRGSHVFVESEVPVKTDAQINDFNERYEKISARPKMGEIDPIRDNCEHTARELAGQGKYSLQSRVLAGISAGGVAGGLTAGALAARIQGRVKKMRKKKTK